MNGPQYVLFRERGRRAEGDVDVAGHVILGSLRNRTDQSGRPTVDVGFGGNEVEMMGRSGVSEGDGEVKV